MTVAFGIELRGDARAQIDAVADQPLVAGLERFHQRFAGVGAGVVDRDGAAIQRLAGGVGDLGRVQRMRRGLDRNRSAACAP